MPRKRVQSEAEQTSGALREESAVYIAPPSDAPTGSVSLTVSVPRTAFSALRLSPEEFTREIMIAAVVQWYDQQRISQGKAAEILGISRGEFLDELYRHGVTPFHYSSADQVVQEARRGYSLD